MLLQLATIFMNVITPVFILVLIGYFAGPRLKLNARMLSRFAYFILVPAFTFNIISTAQVPMNLALQMTAYIIIINFCFSSQEISQPYFSKFPPSRADVEP